MFGGKYTHDSALVFLAFAIYFYLRRRQVGFYLVLMPRFTPGYKGNL